MFAHIYKFKNGMFELIITTSASISEGVISERLVASKTEAKQLAKQIGAKPHNY